MLSLYMSRLSAGLSPENEWSSALSASELRIAAMIKRGLNSEEIADHLSISPHTVRTHRRNIRKELQILNTHANLSIHLRGKQL